MTVQDLARQASLTTFHMADPEMAVTGGYAGDLLSWVMGRAREGDAWLTIMSNQNVAAVSLMAGVSCVILTEGVTPDAALLSGAESRGVNLLGTGESTFAMACKVRSLLG